MRELHALPPANSKLLVRWFCFGAKKVRDSSHQVQQINGFQVVHMWVKHPYVEEVSELKLEQLKQVSLKNKLKCFSILL
jgi:hypothetical protein